MMDEKQIEKMREQMEAMKRASMNAGTMLGLYYVLKFCLFPLGLRSGLLSLAFIVLTVLVPVVAYKIMKRSRLSMDAPMELTVVGAWTFAMRMFFFASLLAAVAHYVYFAFIDGGSLLQALNDNLNQMAALPMEGVAGWQAQLDTFRETFDSVATLTPIQITMELFVNNLFWGCILGLPIAVIAANKSANKNHQ